MESSLHELFEQIIHSEQKAQERKLLLNEVKTEVLICQDGIKKALEEKADLEKQINETLSELNDDLTRVKWMTAKEKALTSQRLQLMKEDAELDEKLSGLGTAIEKEAQNFCQEAADFSLSYDFCSNGIQGRENLARKKMEALREQESQLKNELSSYKLHTTNIVLLEQKKEKARMKTGELKNIIEGLEQQMDDQRVVIQDLTLQKEKVANLPHTDKEFLKLQADMEAIKNDTLEGECATLKLELHQLRHQVWQTKNQRRRGMGPRQSTNQANLGVVPGLERQVPYPPVPRHKPNISRLSQAMKRKQQEEQELISLGKLLEEDGDFEGIDKGRKGKEGDQR